MTSLLAAVLLIVASHNADDNDTKQTPADAVATMNFMLASGDFTESYMSHCHKHLRDQIDENGFVKFMQSPRGKAIVDLFAAVEAAVKRKSGQDVVVAQRQENADEYEFILVQVKERFPRDGEQWHLELKIEDGEWKLMDTD